MLSVLSLFFSKFRITNTIWVWIHFLGDATLSKLVWLLSENESTLKKKIVPFRSHKSYPPANLPSDPVSFKSGNNETAINNKLYQPDTDSAYCRKKIKKMHDSQREDHYGKAKISAYSRPLYVDVFYSIHWLYKQKTKTLADLDLRYQHMRWGPYLMFKCVKQRHMPLLRQWIRPFYLESLLLAHIFSLYNIQKTEQRRH